MRDLHFHFDVKDPDNIIFETPSYAHFGDQVAFLNLVKSLNPPRFKLNTGSWDEALKMALLYFERDTLTTEPGTCVFRGTPEYLDEVYRNRFHKLKTNRTNPERRRKVITYSLDANYARDDKLPPYLSEILPALQAIAECEQVGGHLGVDETARCIEDSRLFVGVDNGVSQLCRSIDTPHILIEHKHNVERAFPRDFHEYFKANSLEAVVELAKCVLAKK